jgi:adenylylsulfate kinase
LPSRRPSGSGPVIWLTGLPSAGKTTLARHLAEQLLTRDLRVELLDGDEIRTQLCRDLGFTRQDRDENVRRMGFVASLLAKHGVIVIVAAVSPYREARAEVRASVGKFIEVYVNAPLAVCEARDCKGFYRNARSGTIDHMTGLGDPYERPEPPDVECHTDRESIDECVEKILAKLTATESPLRPAKPSALATKSMKNLSTRTGQKSDRAKDPGRVRPISGQ